MRRRPSRTTSVRLAAVLWRVRSAVRVSVSGVFRMQDAEREAAAAARRAVGGCREVRQRGLAYVPPYLSFLAGQHFSADRCAAETDAACPGFDHDERVWTGLDDGQA